MKTCFAICLLVAFLVVPVRVHAQDIEPPPPPMYQIFLPHVQAPKQPAAFRLDTKPLNVYMEDIDGKCDGKSGGSTASVDKRHFCSGDSTFDYLFVSSKYYGYFRDADTATEINTGVIYKNVIAMTVDLDQEGNVVRMLRDQYPGSIIFGQRLTASVKVIVFKQ